MMGRTFPGNQMEHNPRQCPVESMGTPPGIWIGTSYQPRRVEQKEQILAGGRSGTPHYTKHTLVCQHSTCSGRDIEAKLEAKLEGCSRSASFGLVGPTCDLWG